MYTNTGTIIIGWLAFHLRSLRFPLVSLNSSHPHNFKSKSKSKSTLDTRISYITTSVDYINILSCKLKLSVLPIPKLKLNPKLKLSTDNVTLTFVFILFIFFSVFMVICREKMVIYICDYEHMKLIRYALSHDHGILYIIFYI